MSDALKNAMLCLVERRKYIVTLGELDRCNWYHGNQKQDNSDSLSHRWVNWRL